MLTPMARLSITVTALAATLVFGLLLYLLQFQGTITFWTLYTLLSISVLVLELSLLTHVLDELSYEPVIATILIIAALGLFIVLGLLARTLYADTLMYWLYGTLFPAACGFLYIIDILQSK